MGFYLYEITINTHMLDFILNIRDQWYLCQQGFGQGKSIASYFFQIPEFLIHNKALEVYSATPTFMRPVDDVIKRFMN
jgi:hypothetical protein